MSEAVNKLERAWVDRVCQMGKGAACCSFLVVSGGDGFCCAKKTEFQALIQKRRDNKSMTAMSDNCSGPPNYQPNESLN